MRMKAKLPDIKDYPKSICTSDIGIESCASGYYQTNKFIRRVFVKRVEKTMDLIPEGEYERILDVGTGIGFILPTISGISDSVFAVDYSNILLSAKYMAKKNDIKNVHFCKMDINSPSFKKESFDLIISLSVFEHLPNLEGVLKGIRKLLRKDGILIAGYPVEDWSLNFIRKIDSLFFRRGMYKRAQKVVKKGKVSGHVNKHSKIRKELKKCFCVQGINSLYALGSMFRIYEFVTMKKHV